MSVAGLVRADLDVGSSAAAQGFDQSLDGLVRQRVITSQERKLLRGGGAAVPIERSRFEEACRIGALSRQYCASGAAKPSMPGSIKSSSSRSKRSKPASSRKSSGGSEAGAGVPLIADFSIDQLLDARVILHGCNSKSLGGLLH